MADEVISTKIVADADFSNLIADVHKVTASLSKLQEQLATSNKMLANNVAVINRNFADTLRSTGQFSTHFVSLASDVEKFGKNLDSGRLKLRDYFGTYQSHIKTSGGLIRELAKQQVAMQNAILQPLGRNAQGLMQFNVHVPRGLDAIKNKTAIARQELAIMNKVIQDGAVQIINWGKNTQWAGRQLTVGLTLPLATFGKAAADAFRVADQELTRLTKVYGDVSGTSAAQLAKVRKDVVATSKELSAAYGTNFSETISLAADIAATGKQGNELLASVKETSRLAVLGEVDRQEAMKATLAIQSAFKQNTTELSDSINFLNAVENQTSTSLADLVEAIPKAGPVIKGLGGNVKDLALYLTAMREGGISASEGANALKSGLASLINPTNVAVSQFKTFGIDLLGIVQKNAGNVTGTLLDLQSALDRLNPLQKQQAIEQLFGKFQFSRMNALFENLGKQGSQTLQVLDLMKASTSDLAAVANREITQMTESASGRYKRALESLKADMAGMGEQFLTIGTKIINVVDKALQFFNNLPKPIKSAITFLGALTAVAGPLIMLTGVLANFFGYILKGVMHMKAFFKGGEGWKYLTPEMMAAEKAGKLVEQTFYSDAKAASILQLALKNLIDEFSILEAKAKSGALAVQPAVSTMAGNLVMGAGGRIVNPQHPLAGAMGTRASTHMVPRSGMTDEQRMAQTIFGLVPGSIPVNRKIGDAPQIYMNEPLPPVKGLTQVGGVSTGVVAGEAARWHAMMATLAMQSKAEIEALKKQIATTGVVSKDFMNQFDDILPIVSGITDNAAKESALVVAELRAGKLTVEQARAKIIALNLEVEQMIASAMGTQATSMGRTINPTIVPTLNQPVVDPSGKSNMRELFKKSKTRDLIDKVARSLGVRTSGAGYNIETTRPKKFKTGDIVPGPNVNEDVVPAMLTPGEFVVNREATAANLPLLQAINNGSFIRSTQYESNLEPRLSGVSSAEMASAFPDRFRGNRSSYRIRGTAGVYLNTVTDPTIIARHPYLSTDGKSISIEAMNSRMAHGGLHHEVYEAAMAASKHRYAGSTDQLLGALVANGIITDSEAKTINQEIDSTFKRDIRRQVGVRDANNKYWGISNRVIQKHLGKNSRAIGFWNEFSSQPAYIVSESLRSSGEPMRSPSMELRKLTHNGETISIDPLKGKRGQSFFAHANTPKPLLQRLMSAGITTMGRRALPFRFSRNINRNMGGIIPGYNNGGVVHGYKRGSRKKVGDPLDGGVAMPGMKSTFAGLGLQMAGQTMGGGIGQVLSSAGLAMTFMPMLQMIPKVNGLMGKLNESMVRFNGPAQKMGVALAEKAKGLSGLSRAFGPVLRGLSFLTRGFGPVGLAITATILAVKGLNKLYKDNQERLRVNRLEYGMSADVMKKAGYSLTDYNGNVKKAIEDAKALQERNKMLYESMYQANVPIKMTIAEYKKLRQEVKQKMPDMIQLFNQKSNSEITTTATRLKAQFMAMGDDVDTATAKVYALMSQSNKAQFAAAAIGSKGFGSIKTAVDAAVASAGTFDDAMKKGDAKSATDALLVSFEGIGHAIEDNAKKNKLEYGDSMDQVLKKMQASGKGQVAINQSVLNELKKQNPELAKILNSTDTATSAWAKYQLALKGVNLDLQNLSAEAANSALKLQAVVSANTASTLKNTAGISDQYKKYDGLKAKIKELEKAAKGQSAKQQIDSRKVIEGLNAQIKKIQEAADAKVKALRAQAEAENNQLEIQKLQLEYQEAVARGDQDAASRAQIALQQFTNQVQSKKAEDAIIAKAELEIKPLQDQINALSKKNQDLADKAALAGESLSSLQGQATTLKEKLDNLEKSVTAAAFNKLIYKALGMTYEGSDQQKTDLAATESAYRGVTGKKSILTVDNKTHPKQTTNLTKTIDTKAEGGATDLIDKVSKGLESGVNAKTVNIYADQIGSGRTGGFTKAAPLPVATSSAYTKKKDGILDDNSKRAILQANPNLTNGSYFEYDGVKYAVKNVTRTQGYVGYFDVVAQKALGGPVAAGRKYMVNDRINPLGAQQEVFVPRVPGMIYPNVDTARFNIPANVTNGVAGGMNNSYNNNTYNIDIALNGTNVTADDVMRKFEQKMATINAQQGRPITVKPVNRAMGGRV